MPLPSTASPPPPLPGTRSPGAPPGGGSARLAALDAATRGARVAIVDDEPLNRAALADFLVNAGFIALESAAEGRPSVQQLRDDRPDLVLLDVAPDAAGEQDAFELLRELQQDRWLCEVPVIALTSHGDLRRRLSALQWGAADFIVKPVDPRELALRLRNTLAAKALGDRIAYTDPVTGLPNREATLHRLEWAVKHARRHGSVGAVLQVGLPRFKQVNDALGPTIGDELLRAVALRLQADLRDTDMVGHGPEFATTHSPSLSTLPAPLADTLPAPLGSAAATAAPRWPLHGGGSRPELSRANGAEFTVLLPVVDRPGDAALVAERIVEQLAEPFDIAGNELYVSCCIGISVFPGDSIDADMVLKHAGAAMRQGRRDINGGGSDGTGAAAPGSAGGIFRFHSGDLNERSLKRLNLERELHHALERHELRLHYQPKIDIASGRLSGAEALVRWQHPLRGLLGPGEFVAVAEDCGLIAPIGQWVLNEALRQVAAWRRRGWTMPQVAVNVAASQLQRPGLCETVRQALLASGVDGASLCLELTESAIIDSAPEIARRLHDIKALGVHIALDDFGTGYSSLSYLHKFPLDEIKIDRSFLAQCGSGGAGGGSGGGDRHSEAITSAIITMGHGLGLRVVAEGVETDRQLDFIRAHRCDVFQGYLFSPPLPPQECAALLAGETEAV